MDDPNDIFKLEDTHSTLYGFVLPDPVDAYYTTKGVAEENVGLIDVDLLQWSTNDVTGYQSPIPPRPGGDPEFNQVFESTRERSTDFVAVNVDNFSELPDWDYTPVYENLRDVPGSDFVQFTQRYYPVEGPSGEGLWTVEAFDTFIRITDPSNILTDIPFPLADEVPHVHMAFDRQKRPMVTWEHDAYIYLYYYNVDAGDYIVVEVSPGITPFIGVEHFSSVNTENERYLIYAREGKLCYRIASERLVAQYDIYQTGIGGVVNVGLSDLNALVISYIDVPNNQIRHLSTLSGQSGVSESLPSPVVSVRSFNMALSDQLLQSKTYDFSDVPSMNIETFQMSLETV